MKTGPGIAPTVLSGGEDAAGSGIKGDVTTRRSIREKDIVGSSIKDRKGEYPFLRIGQKVSGLIVPKNDYVII
jgi:hypothetical protein